MVREAWVEEERAEGMFLLHHRPLLSPGSADYHAAQVRESSSPALTASGWLHPSHAPYAGASVPASWPPCTQSASQKHPIGLFFKFYIVIGLDDDYIDKSPPSLDEISELGGSPNYNRLFGVGFTECRLTPHP